jgi:hypothetical protein
MAMMTIETEIRPKLAQCARVVLKGLDRGESNLYEYQQAQHWLYCLDWVLGGTRLPKEDLRSWVNRLSND